MTSKERLEAALKKKEVDRLPWAPLIDDYFTSSLPEQGFSMNAVEALRYIGADILLRHVPATRIEFKKVEHKRGQKGDEIVDEFITPVGTIRQINRTSQTGKTDFVAKCFVTNKEEAKILQYVYEDMVHKPDFEAFTQQQTYIGDDGLATTSSPITPIQALMQGYMHIEPFVYGMSDYPEVLEELMEAMHHAHLREYRVFAESPAFAVFAYEDTSTTSLTPTWYDRYCKDYINQYASILKEGGKVFITHMCGKLKGFAGSIREGLMDGLDSVCPPTTGDTWLHEAQKLWPDKVIIGGIEPPNLKAMSVDETRAYIMDVLKNIGRGDGIILSTGDATSYGTPLENLMEVSRLVKEYGKYPVNIS